LQKSSCDIDQLHDSLIYTTIIPVSPILTGNISIDSCWFETTYRKSNSQEHLFVKISKQNRPEQKDISLRLFVNDSLKGVTNITAEEGTSVQTIEFINPNAGDVNIRLEIEDFPIEFDNIYRFSYSIAKEIPVLQVFSSEPNEVIKAMYANHVEIKYETKKSVQLAPSDFENYSLVIAENQTSLSDGNAASLREFVMQGGSLMIIPSSSGNISQRATISSAFNIQMDSVGRSAEINHIEISEELFANAIKEKNKGVTSLSVNNPQYFSISSNQRFRSLMTFSNKQPAFVQLNYGQGKIYISAVPFERNNQIFISNPIITPLLFNPALFSRPSHSNQTFIGDVATVRIKGFNNGSVEIISEDGLSNFAPEYRYDRFNSTMSIMPSENITKDGVYSLKTDNKTYPLSYNYSRAESDLAIYSSDEIKDIKSNGGNFIIEEPQENTNYQFTKLSNETQWIWIYFIVAALACLLTEKIIIRYL